MQFEVLSINRMRANLHISLPAHLKQWVEQQATTSGYDTAGEYVQEVLRKEQVNEARKKIDEHLLAALDNGQATEMTTHDWEEIRREGRERAAGGRNTRSK
jgi:antitoxin ParD1/3/4